jgi:hypothetical protein
VLDRVMYWVKIFDSKEIKTYWEDKNRYMLADKSSIESAAPLTEDEMLNFYDYT